MININDQIQSDFKDLSTDFERFERDQVALTLARMTQELTSQADRIEEIKDNSKNLSAAKEPVKNLICQEIVACTHGNVVVTEYVQKACAKQDFYLFISTHWVLVPSQVFHDFVKDACKKMKVGAEWAENPKFMNIVFEQIGFIVSHDQQQYVPSNEVWVNLMNGTLKIKTDGTRTFGQHLKEDFFTHVLPYSYDEHAECPRWRKFLDRVMPDKDTQRLMAEFVGYCFTRNLKLEKMAVLYGVGCNGKSVFLDVLESLMGRSNVSNVSLSDATRDPEKRSLLENKLLNSSHESSSDIDFAMMKQLCSNEPIDGRRLYKGPHTIYNYGKFVTSYNVLPNPETTHGFFRRWVIFPFDQVIPEEEQDVELTSKLREELPGILNWALEALEGLVRNKRFSESQLCKDALNEYRSSSNSALLFFEDCCELDDNARMKPKNLYETYCTFCRDEDVKFPFGKKKFYEILRSKGVNQTKIHGVIYVNIKLKNNEETF